MLSTAAYIIVIVFKSQYVVSMMHLSIMVSSLTYEGLSKTEMGANFGQPNAMFISECGEGLWNEALYSAGSGLNHLAICC